MRAHHQMPSPGRHPICFAALLLEKSKELRSSDSNEDNIFSEACQVLGLPYFAVLQADKTIWDRRMTSVTIDFSVLRAGLIAFENAVPRCHQLRQLFHQVQESRLLQPLSIIQAAVRWLEAGMLDEALETLNSPGQEISSADLQSRQEHPQQWRFAQ